MVFRIKEIITITKCGECPWWSFNNGCNKGLFNDRVDPLLPPPNNCPIKDKIIKIKVK